jgi:lysozyme family protein
MKDTFQRALALVLRHEGGFVNHPKDPGGATNKGITIAVFREVYGKGKTVDDLKRITDEQVAHIYRTRYWAKVRGDDLPAGLDYAVFDFAVNSGPARVAKHLQRIVGVTQDGVIGPQTLAALRERKDVAYLINRLCDDRLAFLRSLSTYKTFGKGWERRVEDVRRDALVMVGATQAPASDNTQAATSILSAIITFIAKLLRRA